MARREIREYVLQAVGWGLFYLPGERRRMEQLTRTYEKLFDDLERRTEQAAVSSSPVGSSQSTDSTYNVSEPVPKHRARRRTFPQPGPTRSSGSDDELDGTVIRVSFGPLQIEKAMQVFGLDPDVGTSYRLWFGDILDGPDGPEALPLLQRGIIISVRETKRGGDITLKLRCPEGCIDVAAWRGRTQNLGGSTRIVGDWSGDRRLVSASLSEELYGEAKDVLLDGYSELPSLMAEGQRLLARELLVPLARVELIGPVSVHSWNPESDGDVAAELWTIGDATRFLEVSVFVIDDAISGKQRLEQRALDGGLALDPLLNIDLNAVVHSIVR